MRGRGATRLAAALLATLPLAGPATHSAAAAVVDPIPVAAAAATRIGTPVGAEYPVGPGLAQNYTNGRVYFTPATGAHYLYADGDLPKYDQLGATGGLLGFPTTDPAGAGGGSVQQFERGRIYFGTAVPAQEVHGAILAAYDGLGGPGGLLGFPVSDETAAPDQVGRFSYFARGGIYWTPAAGAHEVHGAILQHWAQLGFEHSVLGYPTSDESATPDGIGRYNVFAGGTVYWTPATGAQEVHGAIRQHWAQLGSERGVLGYPTSDERTAADGVGRFGDFTGGVTFWNPGTGAREVHGAILARWAALGWERGALGYPTSDEFTPYAGARQSNFQFGFIRWLAADGSLNVSTQPLAGRTVVLDPGHDGGNASHPAEIGQLVWAGTAWKECDTTGTVSLTGYPEYAFTLDVAQRAMGILQSEGARVVLTRYDSAGWGPCITTRAAIGNNEHAAAAVSIHGDGGPSSGRGFHVIEPGYVAGLTGPIVGPSDALARTLRASFQAGTGMPYATYLAGGTGLDTRTDLGGLNLSQVPKVFIECGNMQNGTDAYLMGDPGQRQRMAEGIAAGIRIYLAGR
ncbi:MAG: N-acetylmuramoyl-L-alanine amidase [Actinomycetota bacterium]|nr:N-acetylmuramoyl-L-alanine amidase [Actinomycetota bacterium]